MVRQSGQVVATVWMDNKEVHVLFTNVKPEERGTVRRMQTDATARNIEAPANATGDLM